MQKFLYGKMMLGIGRKRQQIGVGIGLQKKINIFHPKYAPVNRYVRDIIGCLNNWVDGWVDWNMVLDTKGGPNWFKNWCIAPVIVDPDKDEVYFTPLYYTMAHFSKFIRPEAKVIGLENSR